MSVYLDEPIIVDRIIRCYAAKTGRLRRKRRMTDSKIKAARRLLAGGTPPRDVAEDLGGSVPTLDRWLPASARV